MNTLQKRAAQRGQGGFTLIELLVVIAILAILAGVVVFAVGNSTDNAKVSACKVEARTLSTAANAAKAAHLNQAAGSWSSMSVYLDGGSAAMSGKYWAATESVSAGASATTLDAGDTVTFAAGSGGTVSGCTAPSTVTY